MNEAFLVDECLSLELVALAQARGFHATHVVFRNLQGTSDRTLVEVAARESFALVINNRRDFLRLYAEQEIHAGLVVLVPGGLVSEDQMRLFDLALDAIEAAGEIINQVVEVEPDGRVKIRPWPPV